MKSIIKILLIVVVFFSCVTCTTEEKNEMAIVDFIVNIRDAIPSDTLSELFEGELASRKQSDVTLYARSQAAKVMIDLSINPMELTEENAIRIGQAIPSSKVLVSRISYIDNYYLIVSKAIDTKNGEILFIEKVMAWDKNDLNLLMPILADRVLKRMRGENVEPFVLKPKTPDDGQDSAAYYSSMLETASQSASSERGDTSVSSRMPLETFNPMPPDELHKALAQTASELVGKSDIPTIENKKFNNDASGFVSYVYAKNGISLSVSSKEAAQSGNMTYLIYAGMNERGFIYKEPIARSIGDIVFFDNTYDADKNNFWDDTFTFIGIVTKIDDLGTHTVVGFSGSAAKEYKMNLNFPDDSSKNSWLRRKGAENYPNERYYTSGLFNSFGHYRE